MDEIINGCELSYEYVNKVRHNRQYNEIISDYYFMLSDESSGSLADKFYNTAERVRNCAKLWNIDYYRKSQIKDVKNVNRCKCRFCLNCQKLTQASRLYKFSTLLDSLVADGKYLYHLSLTVPNVPGALLNHQLDSIFHAFSYFSKFLTGQKKIKGIELGVNAFGLLRSFEVTYSNNNTFHGHLHVILACNEPLDLSGENVNAYSYDYDKELGRRIVRNKFSDLEILIQKIWRLCYDREFARVPEERDPQLIPVTWNTPFSEYVKRKAYTKTVTAQRIQFLDIGYSAKISLVEDNNYYEVFKYVIKLDILSGYDMNYEIFKILLSALSGRKIFQGYGCFYDFNTDALDESFDEKYNELIERLQEIEDPFVILVDIDNIAMDLFLMRKVKYISRRNIYKYLKELSDNG